MKATVSDSVLQNSLRALWANDTLPLEVFLLEKICSCSAWSSSA